MTGTIPGRDGDPTVDAAAAAPFVSTRWISAMVTPTEGL